MRRLGVCTAALFGSWIVACGGSSDSDGDKTSDPSVDGGESVLPDGGSAASDGGTPSNVKPTATDGIKNGDETDVDCGGAKSKTPRCKAGKTCAAETDCDSQVCVDGVCRAASNDDGKTNGTESDIDCGAIDEAKKPIGKKCKADQHCLYQVQCESSICLNDGVDGTDGTCAGGGATDGIQNGGETDIDCGGPLMGGAPRCAPSKGCALPSDCTSAVCTANVCQPPKPNDSTRNGDETDVDCGGADTPPCATNLGCASVGDTAGADYGARCVEKVCTGGVCQPPKYNDTKQNGTETDIDCGGGVVATDPRCVLNKNCLVKSDCGVGVEGPLECLTNAGTKKCVEGGATDGVKNRDETDIDCGGTKAPKCGATKACLLARDCESGTCKADKTCSQPSHSDGVVNLGETGIDCGGAVADPVSGLQAPRCAAGLDCLADADCKKPLRADGVTEVAYSKGTCNDAKKCAAAPSCRHQKGGYTCGLKGAPEDCCLAVTLPAKTTVKLDRYKITAGRMREFVTTINNDPNYNGDIEAWYLANRASFPAEVQAQLDIIDARTGLQNGVWLPRSNTEYPRGTVYALGGKIYHTNLPSGVQGCYVGNAGQQGYGQHTYFNGGAESDDRGYDQAYLDTLIMNCAPMTMFAAFCAWDGGRLQLDDEKLSLWDATNLSTSGGAVYDSGAKNWVKVGPGTSGFTNSACPTCDLTFANWRNSYEQPENAAIRDYVNPNYDKIWDEAYKMSVPGRFIKDKGKASTHYDVHGGGIEFTGTMPGNGTATIDAQDANRTCATDRECIYKCGTGTPKKCVAGNISQIGINARGGSQEGHGLKDGYGPGSFSVMSKYGRSAARCARF